MTAPWLTYATAYIGTREIPGPMHNPTIVGWLRRYAHNIKKAWIERKGDEIANCAVFVTAMLDHAGIKGTNHGLARKYISWGKPSKFKRGAIIVIQRERKDGENETGSGRGGYHVGFLWKVTKNFYWIVGANQRNRVSKAAFSKKNYRVCGVRWPEGA